MYYKNKYKNEYIEEEDINFPKCIFSFFSSDKVDLGQKSVEDKIKQKRKQLAAEIRELCKEFDLSAGYNHISDLFRKLEPDEY